MDDSEHMPTITGVSHIDLSVTDLDKSEAFYTEVFGAQRLFEGRNDDHGFSSRYVYEPNSTLVFGLVKHDAGVTAPFDETSIGLDHLALNVGSREDLDAWAARLDELGVARSPIAEQDTWDVLVFRDPDNIQLELFFLKVDPSVIIG